MLPAFLTTILFSISGVSAGKMTRILGGVEANFWRILLATSLLAIYAHTFGQGFGGSSLQYFFLSGLFGFGLGDLALYQALPRIGSRLSMLIVHCVAAPLAATAEYFWLGNKLSAYEASCTVAILFGVGMALAPKENLHIPKRTLIVGCIFGVIASFGQGMGAVISRKAYTVATLENIQIDGLTAGYQRIWGGVIIASISFAILKWRQSTRFVETSPPSESGRLIRASKFLVINAFAGPVLGVGCFQWALATTKTGIVLPIVALTPLVIIPLSSKFEGEKPSLFSLLGGVIAVGGVVALRIGMP